MICPLILYVSPAPAPQSNQPAVGGAWLRVQARLAAGCLPSKSLPKPTAPQESCARCRGAGGPAMAWPLSALILFQTFNRDNEEQEIYQSHISPIILTPFNKSDDT